MEESTEKPGETDRGPVMEKNEGAGSETDGNVGNAEDTQSGQAQ